MSFLYEYLANLNEFIWYQIKNNSDTKLILVGTLAIIVVGSTIVKWFKMKTYFKRLNIDGPTPLPIVGNFLGLASKGFDRHDSELLNKYNRTCGYFEGSTPIVLTCDPTFIKNVMIKDHAYFVNRREFEGLFVEPLNKFLTVLKDEEWKNVRSIITASFTSGKLKEMSKHFEKPMKRVDNYLDNLITNNNHLDTKNLFGAYTLDIISSCLFGIETNAIEDPHNEILKHLNVLVSNTFSTKLILLFMFPRLARWLSDHNLVEFFSKSTFEFLSKVSQEIIERRRQAIERRIDFIQVMIDHEKSNDQTNQSSIKRTLTDLEILSQAILFLAAGYETTTTSLVLISYYLAMNPEYQTKLCQEVDDILANSDDNDNNLNYESVSQMKYMDMVINESLRICPPTLRADRVSNIDYEWNGMKLPKNTVWTVSIWALHHDKEFYPEPEKFLPDRFSEESKKQRPNEAFIPFGVGHRSCVGMRFATIEMKFLLAHILSRYEFVPCETTPKTIKIDRSGMGRPAKPIRLNIRRRNRNSSKTIDRNDD